MKKRGKIKLVSEQDIVYKNRDKYIEQLNLIITDDVFNVGIIGDDNLTKNNIINEYALKKQDCLIVPITSYTGNNNIEEIENDIIRLLALLNYKEDLKDSRLERISCNNTKFSKFSIIYIMSAIAGIILGFIFSKTYGNVLNILVNKVILYILMFIFLIIFGISFVYITILLLSKTSKNDDGEYIELDSKARPLKKYLIEISKIIKKSNKRIIIFENIELLDNELARTLLNDLRAINEILNNSIDFDNEENLIFVYCLSETIFNSLREKNNIIDESLNIIDGDDNLNCSITTNNLLLTNNIRIDNKLIDIVVNRINDIRTIKNIINDYILISDLLKIDNSNRIFAIAIIQNTLFENEKIIELKIKERIKKPNKFNDLLNDLIINEYIDDNYKKNMGASLTKLDKKDNKFLWNINNNINSMDIEIIDYKDLIKHLSYDNINKYVLNIYLIEYLMNSKDELYNHIIDLFIDIDNYKYEFLLKFKKYNKDKFYKFINDVNKKFPIWNSYCKSNLSDEVFFTSCMYYYNWQNEIINRELLKKAIDENLTQDDIKYNKVVLNSIKYLDIKLSNIRKYKKYKNYFKDNMLYAFNKENIIYLLNGENNFNKLINEKFNNYVLENINVFEDIYSSTSLVINNLNLIEKLMNVSNNLTFKEKIIDRESFNMNIDTLDNDIVKYIYHKNKINNTWQNINKLSEIINIDSLVEYMYINIKTLIKNYSDINSLDPKLVKSLIIKILDNKKESLARNILLNYKRKFTLPIEQEITNRRLIFMINNNLVECSERNVIIINELNSIYIIKFYQSQEDKIKIYNIINKYKLNIKYLLESIDDISVLFDLIFIGYKEYSCELLSFLSNNKVYEFSYDKNVESKLKKTKLFDVEVIADKLFVQVKKNTSS